MPTLAEKINMTLSDPVTTLTELRLWTFAIRKDESWDEKVLQKEMERLG